jgi:hypothetical protein
MRTHALHQGEITRGAAPSSSIHVNVTAAAIPFSAGVYVRITQQIKIHMEYQELAAGERRKEAVKL